MIVLAMFAGLVVVAGIYELEEGETPLDVWKAKVRQAVERYEQKQSEGLAVNTEARARGNAGLTSDEVTTCPTPLYPDR